MPRPSHPLLSLSYFTYLCCIKRRCRTILHRMAERLMTREFGKDVEGSGSVLISRIVSASV
jgi:hypothetical protein